MRVLLGFSSSPSSRSHWVARDRTFNRLDGADGDLFAEIEVYCTDFRLCVGRDLLFCVRATAE